MTKTAVVGAPVVGILVALPAQSPSGGQDPIDQRSCAEWTTLGLWTMVATGDPKAMPSGVERITVAMGTGFIRGYASGVRDAWTAALYDTHTEQAKRLLSGPINIRSIVARIATLCRERPYATLYDATMQATIEALGHLVKGRR